MKRNLYVLSLVCVAASGYAQAVISSGGSSFGWTSAGALSGASNRTGTGGGVSNVFTSLGSADQAFQEWWWYRVNGVNTREFALSTEASSPVISANTMTLSYAEPEGFSSTLVYTITNSGGTTTVTGTNTIKNTSTSGAMNFDFFLYNDWDLNASGSDDSASLVAVNPAIRIGVSDVGGPMKGEIRGIDGIAYKVTSFSTLRGSLSNSSIDNLDNSGLPFGPGDFTSGIQWNFSLAPGESIALQTSRVLTPVPEPASMMALGLGALALMRRRRK